MSRPFAAVMCAVLAALVAVPAARASAESPVRAGDAVVVEAADQSIELDHGGSVAVFSLRLPEGAACPGDSLHEQWRVQSFVVPASVDPGRLTYDLTQPHGDGYFPLFGTDTHPFMQRSTGANTEAGKPGTVLPLPPLSFGVFIPGLLKSGTYRIGVACTLDRKTAEYWDTQIVIAETSSDQPAGFVWRLTTAPASLTKVDGGSNAGFIATIVAVVAVLGFVGWRRSRRKPSSSLAAPTTTRPALPSRSSR